MTALDFQPDLFTIEELLTRRYYVIPRFQRPYSWDDANLEEFWRDCIVDNDAGYFVGPMVGWRKQNSIFASIVDGQQRLTTITLALTVLRDELKGAGEHQLALGLHALVERPDRDYEDRFVLQPQEDAPYLNEGILSFEPDDAIAPSSVNDKTLRTARNWLRARVREMIKSAPASKTVDILKDTRDRLLALRVIWVELGNEDDAYIVFETLNSRGKDLAVADLLKNHLLNRIRVKNRRADTAKRSWDKMRANLDSTTPPVDADRYILHWWLSREGYVGQRQLFKEIRGAVRTAPEARARLTSLTSDAELYRVIVQPGAAKWGPEELELRDALEALTIFGVSQPAPFLLAIMRARSEGVPRIGPLRSTLQAVERFHFQGNTIAGQSSSGGVSQMYARFARSLTASSTAQARTKVLKEAREALAARIPDEEAFVAGFGERLIFTDQLTRNKRLVQYVLRNLHAASRDHRPDRPSIEHLLPQSEIDSGTDPSVVGQIGNLLWVDEKLNGELKNKTFTQKKAVLAQHQALYDFTDVLQANQWGQAEIEARTRRLAELALSGPWKLPV